MFLAAPKTFLVMGIGMLACEQRELTPPSLPPPDEEPELAPPSVEEVYAPTKVSAGADAIEQHIVPAFSDDGDYANEEPELARRLVYRVALRVPANLGVASETVPRPSGELYIDVSRDRLRARFSGAGWPVPAGSEVRLRRDEPGVYLFDGEGGRPLGPGQLAQWFEGGRLRFEPSHRVRPPPNEEQLGPGDLTCRLIAEWLNASVDALSRRCGDGGSPPDFRVGLWLAERTADVGVQLPRSALRADHVDPPPPVPRSDSRAFLTPDLMRRIRRDPGPRPPPAEDAPGEGIRLTNRGHARMIVTVQGTPVGWVDRGATAHFVGLEPGTYRVGAMRPFGLQYAGLQPVTVPGHLLLPRWVPPTPDE